MKVTKSILKGQQGKWFFFFQFGSFFVFIKLRICGPLTKCARNFHARKHVKLHIKLCIHFLCFWFFTKIFMHNYIHMWKITTTIKLIIIWIIQYLSFKFIPFRFYIWNIVKTKSLSLVVKKWYPEYEYAQNAWHTKQSCSLWYKKQKPKVIITYFGMIQNYDKFSKWNIEFDKIYTLWEIDIYSTMISTKHMIYWGSYVYF